METSRTKAALFVALILVMGLPLGCKSGWKMDNPFAHNKPKAPSKEIPAEIDGIQLSEPPEKYSREFTKSEKKEKDHSLAQSGKYDSFPSEDTLQPPTISRVAMNPESDAARPGGTIPSFTSIADNMTATTPELPGSATSDRTAPGAAMPNAAPSSMPGNYSAPAAYAPNQYPQQQNSQQQYPQQQYPQQPMNPQPAAAPQQAIAPAGTTDSTQSMPFPSVGTPFPSYGTTTAPAAPSAPATSPAPASYDAAGTSAFAPGSIGGY